MIDDNASHICGRIIERYCSHIDENVVLRSISSDMAEYECLCSHICTLRGECPKRYNKDTDKR